MEEWLSPDNLAAFYLVCVFAVLIVTRYLLRLTGGGW